MSTVKVLSLDGGGMRGLISACILKKIVDRWGINPNELYRHFDVITGTSIGGILALAVASGVSLDILVNFFTVNGPYIFTTSRFFPSVAPSILTKLSVLSGLSNSFYPAGTSGIGVDKLYSTLSSVLGDATLQDMKTNVLITSFEKNDVDPVFEKYTNTPVYFSNISSDILPSLQGQNLKAVDVGMCTSAAPLYFPPYTIGGSSYIDGGVVNNNPAAVALSVAKSLKPTANRSCVLSLGTGLGDIGFPPDALAVKLKYEKEIKLFRTSPEAYAVTYKVTPPELERLRQLDNLGVLEGGKLLMYLIGVMTAGPQEIADFDLKIRSDYTLENLFYFRAQMYLDPAKDTELDSSKPDVLQYYRDVADQYFNDHLDDIDTFISHMDLE